MLFDLITFLDRLGRFAEIDKETSSISWNRYKKEIVILKCFTHLIKKQC